MAGLLVAVEGIDGAGKNTLTGAVAAELAARGRSVARAAFPRYGTLHADLAADALRGTLPGVASSAHAMALLFALDRRDAAGDLAALAAAHDVVLVDRYVASNVAYTSARLGEVDAAAGPAQEWLAGLEFDRFAVPRPGLQLYVDTDVAEAARRAAERERGDASRTRDRYERDGDLQARTAAAYAALAGAGWASPWLRAGERPDVARIAAAVERVAADHDPGAR